MDCLCYKCHMIMNKIAPHPIPITELNHTLKSPCIVCGETNTHTCAKINERRISEIKERRMSKDKSCRQLLADLIAATEGTCITDDQICKFTTHINGSSYWTDPGLFKMRCVQGVRKVLTNDQFDEAMEWFKENGWVEEITETFTVTCKIDAVDRARLDMANRLRSVDGVTDVHIA